MPGARGMMLLRKDGQFSPWAWMASIACWGGGAVVVVVANVPSVRLPPVCSSRCRRASFVAAVAVAVFVAVVVVLVVALVDDFVAVVAVVLFLSRHWRTRATRCTHGRRRASRLRWSTFRTERYVCQLVGRCFTPPKAALRQLVGGMRRVWWNRCVPWVAQMGTPASVVSAQPFCPAFWVCCGWWWRRLRRRCEQVAC